MSPRPGLVHFQVPVAEASAAVALKAKQKRATTARTAVNENTRRLDMTSPINWLR